MIQNIINVNTMNEASANEIELIEIYEGNQNKTEYTVNEESISLDSYTLDNRAVVDGVCWKPVVGFEEYYEVSDYGAVRSLHKDRNHYHNIMKGKIDRYGYIVHILRGNKTKKYPTVHRLVAFAFIPNPNNYAQIDHIDGNKKNNNVSNLRWCTAKENINNPNTLSNRNVILKALRKTEEYKRSRKVGTKKAAILKASHVVCIETGEWFNSALECGEKFNLDRGTILNHCKRFEEGLKYRGNLSYHFRYATEEENAANLPKYIEYVNELVKTF